MRWIANGKIFTLSDNQVEYYSGGYPFYAESGFMG
jgi:hypothetical protein